MDERVQFCRARDGVRLAHATTGAGYPLVKVANWLSHLEYDIESPVWGHLFRALATEHMLIRYDQRGTGLSDRDVESMSFADWTTDLETVVDAVRLERFDLLGISQGGPVAIAYAVQHPERVRHLILYGTFAIAPKSSDDEQQALLVLMREGWGRENQAYRQFFTSLFIPGGTADQMRWFNALVRRSASPGTAVRILKEVWTIDVAQMAARLTVPTLILHCRGDEAVPFSAGRELAALVPGASFVPMDGSNHYFLEHEPAREIFLRELHAFVGPSGEHGPNEGIRQDTADAAAQETPVPSRLAAETTSVVRPQAQRSFASGRYVLKQMLGEGGQKSVYLVQDTVLDRECALALVKSDLAEPEDILRIRREAQTMARIGARPAKPSA
jgi:pimeloyl-ACP methyl ester carboxylesterase